MSDYYTEDLAEFGAREQKLMLDIASAWRSQGLPVNFHNAGVKFAFNKNSGFVFLTNEEFEVALINCDTGKLESFYSTPYRGYEGFLSDLLAEYAPDDLGREDERFIRDMIKAESLDNEDLPKAWRSDSESE